VGMLPAAERDVRPIMAALMVSPPAVALDGGARLSLWTIAGSHEEGGGWEDACRGRVGEGVNGASVQSVAL
jgi:hypothetical protein